MEESQNSLLGKFAFRAPRATRGAAASSLSVADAVRAFTDTLPTITTRTMRPAPSPVRLNSMPGADDCDGSDLCSELRGNSDTEFHRTYPNVATRVLEASDDCVAIVDLSPMVVGHVLVCPRAHYYSMAGALRDTNFHLWPFLSRFLSRYEKVFGEYVVVEHGSTEDMAGSACISHAHLHIVPIALAGVLERMRSDGLALTSIDSWEDLSRVAIGDHPYFFATDNENFRIVVNPPRTQSQYFRIVIGAAVGISPDECDWAVVNRRHHFEQTLAQWQEQHAPTKPQAIP